MFQVNAFDKYLHDSKSVKKTIFMAQRILPWSVFLPFVLLIVQRLGDKDSAHLRFHIKHPSRVS